jgi:hypothetical protein
MTDSTTPVPVTPTGQQVTTHRDIWQRVGRTLIQIIVSGGLTALIDLAAQDLPASVVPYLYAVVMLVTVTAQNYAESQGIVPTILKKPPVG